jgi:hypothetical protein
VKSAFITTVPAGRAQQGKLHHLSFCPGTVHSLQVRRVQQPLTSRANSSKAQTRLLVQRWILELKEQLTAAETQTLILLLHNVGDLSYPREAGEQGLPGKGLLGS